MKYDIIFIREKIAVLAERFNTNPILFFNEADLQTELFTLLLEKNNSQKEISNVYMWGTQKKKPLKRIFTKRVHSELLLPEGRIDLAVLDLDNVTFAVNSKGNFGHIQLRAGNHVVIEIKASRTNRSSITSKPQWSRLLTSDIFKLNKYVHPCFLCLFRLQSIADRY